MNERLDIAETADLWLLRRESGHDVENDPAFMAWFAASPQNAKAWAQGVSIWEQVGDALETADPLLNAMRKDALMARPARSPSWPLRTAAGIAAVLFAGVIGWSTLVPRRLSSHDTPWVAANATATFSNGTALPRTIILADASHVTLDAGSSIAVAYSDAHRGARLLQGRAFFEVTHDPHRPFRLEANDRWVDDLGTQFSAGIAGRTVTVVLVTGKVSVGVPHAQRLQELAPGQRLDIEADGSEHIAAADPDTDLAWRSGFLVFHDTPLAKAVAEINRYGGPPITASSLGDLKVSGRFSAGDPRRFARMLAQIYPIHVQDRPDGGAALTTEPAQ